MGRASAGPQIDIEALIKNANVERLADDPYWHRLLHYQKNIFGMYKSEIDDKSFFLSPQGQTDPNKELEATLGAFLTNQITGDEPAICQYPARFSWLDEKLNLPPLLSPKPCERFESWKEKLNPESLSMVFASYYLNNPASLYGHTFLKLGRKGYTESKGLLDYTVNFAADANTRNGVAFAVRGLTGGYRGKFSTIPYYIQIQKYNNIEARDLWEYKLNIDPKSLDRLVQHLWELGHTSMAYYFFNKNCSYQLFPLLDVTYPTLNFARSCRYRTVPLDTLRSVLAVPGLVTSVQVRPSHVKAMLQRRSYLTAQEVQLAENLVNDMSRKPLDPLLSLPKLKQAHILDSAFDFLKYRHGFYRDQPNEIQEKEKRLLTLRQALHVVVDSTFPFRNALSPPEKGHKSGRVALGGGVHHGRYFEEVGIRPALHDLESNPDGFVEGSQLEMLHLRFRFEEERKKINLEEFTLVEILSLSAWDRWVHPPSWHVRTGFDVAHDLGRDPEDSLFYGLSGGSGYSFGLSKRKRNIWYALWQAETALSGSFDKDYRAGAGGMTGLALELHARWRMHGTATWMRYALGHIQNKVKLHLTQTLNITQNFEFRLSLERQNSYKEGTATLNIYY